MRRKLAAKNAVIKSVVQASCATLGSCTKGMVKNFCLRLDRSVCDAFRLCSLLTQFHTDISIDGVTLQFSKGASSEESGSSTMSEDVVDLAGDIEVPEL